MRGRRLSHAAVGQERPCELNQRLGPAVTIAVHDDGVQLTPEQLDTIGRKLAHVVRNVLQSHTCLLGIDRTVIGEIEKSRAVDHRGEQRIYSEIRGNERYGKEARGRWHGHGSRTPADSLSLYRRGRPVASPAGQRGIAPRLGTERTNASACLWHLVTTQRTGD